LRANIAVKKNHSQIFRTYLSFLTKPYTKLQCFKVQFLKHATNVINTLTILAFIKFSVRK
jgi:hypothetical protein